MPGKNGMLKWYIENGTLRFIISFSGSFRLSYALCLEESMQFHENPKSNTVHSLSLSLSLSLMARPSGGQTRPTQPKLRPASPPGLSTPKVTLAF